MRKTLLEVWDYQDWNAPRMLGRVAVAIDEQRGDIPAIDFTKIVEDTMLRTGCDWNMFKNARKAWLN